jgi:hypothetical protein
MTIDLLAKSRKTSEDKEYELQEIDEELYVYNTVAFVGKNASGKTTAIELLNCCYSILGNFRLENDKYDYDNIDLEIFFYNDGYIYCYKTILKSDNTLGNKANFTNQHIYRKKYYKTKINSIYNSDDFEELKTFGDLPEDIANVFFVLKNKSTRAVYFNSDGEGADTYRILFKAMKNYNIENEVLENIIRIFDENIQELNMVDDHNYKIRYNDRTDFLSDKELMYFLSSGTTKGILLYVMVAASLKMGFDLLIDEVENHFHKTLVENMISLYKDKSVNKHNATLIFTSHYCEVLDLFNRQDNIWIAKSEGKVYLSNMYEDYDIRSELLKSKQFYTNTFQTAVNYNMLMDLKRKLKK